MPSGGKRAGAGRKRRLTPAQQEEVARAYRYRMEVWTATQAHVRDPNIKKRREIDKQMRKLAKTHMAVPGDDGGASFFKEDVIWFHKQVRAEMEKLQAELKDIPNKSAAIPKKWAKGARESFLRELMADWKISRRLVVYCINNF